MLGVIKDLIRPIVPVRIKEYYEMKYWVGKKRTEGQLSNKHYEQFYTTHFDINGEYYQDKVLLDIGCGPRGSLEWANMAKRRIGLDPLADKYLKLGASEHQMEYMASSSEDIPLPNSSCDAVFSFNSIDHVESLEETAKEIKRVTKPGGIFLVLVEVNHPPTVCEPHGLTPQSLLDLMQPEFSVNDLKVYKSAIDHDMYASLLENQLTDQPEATTEIGFMSVKFVRV